ncbi:YtxH domain-containing protein [Dehalogenimonas sp. THU2]|uniref:YtxH domain-containing protein n=1 Tax=Dehalogenimonas sp. THU2 TaxID=3151121 RepID=UPI0032188A80
MERDYSGNILTGLLLGTAIGIGLGLLYAPRPGSEIRAGLYKQAQEVLSQVAGIGDTLMGRMDDVGCTVRECGRSIRVAVKGDGAGRLHQA